MYNQSRDEFPREEEESDESEEEEEYKNGFTIKGASNLLKAESYTYKNTKPKRVKPINEEKYFNAITRMKPDCFLKREDKSNFFYNRVGRPLQHYKSKYTTKYPNIYFITHN